MKPGGGKRNEKALRGFVLVAGFCGHCRSAPFVAEIDEIRAVIEAVNELIERGEGRQAQHNSSLPSPRFARPLPEGEGCPRPVNSLTP